MMGWGRISVTGKEKGQTVVIGKGFHFCSIGKFVFEQLVSQNYGQRFC